MVPPEELGVSFDSIGALEGVKETLREVVMLPLQRPEVRRGVEDRWHTAQVLTRFHAQPRLRREVHRHSSGKCVVVLSRCSAFAVVRTCVL